MVCQVRTFVDEDVGHSSYVIDLGEGTTAVVDAPRFPTGHLAATPMIVASTLAWRGRSDITVPDEGADAWTFAADRPLEAPR